MEIYLPLLVQGLAIGVLTGILYVLVALGLTLIYGILHIVNFAHGEIYMLGAMAVFYLHVVGGLPLVPTLAAIVLLSVLLGVAVERGVFRSLRGQWLQLVVASVGISLVIQSVGWIVFGIQEKSVPSYLPGIVQFLGVRLPRERLLAAAVALVLVAGLYLLVYRTKAGLAMRAIEEDEETARMLGVNANRVASLSVALGFVLAAVARRLRGARLLAEPGHGARAHPDVVSHHHRGRPGQHHRHRARRVARGRAPVGRRRPLRGGGRLRHRLRRDDRRARPPARRPPRPGLER